MFGDALCLYHSWEIFYHIRLIVTSLQPTQPYVCPSANEVTLKYMGNMGTISKIQHETASRKFGTKQLPKQWLVYCEHINVNCALKSKLQSGYDKNPNILCQENANEDVVCKIAAILFGHESLKPCCIWSYTPYNTRLLAVMLWLRILWS